MMAGTVLNIILYLFFKHFLLNVCSSFILSLLVLDQSIFFFRLLFTCLTLLETIGEVIAGDVLQKAWVRRQRHRVQTLSQLDDD